MTPLEEGEVTYITKTPFGFVAGGKFLHHHDKITIGDKVVKVRVSKSQCVPLDEFLKFLNYVSAIQDDVKLYVGKNEICYSMKPGKIIVLTKVQLLLVVLGILSRQSVYIP